MMKVKYMSFETAHVQRQHILQSGDHGGTKEMTEGKHTSPPPETLNPVRSHSLRAFNMRRLKLLKNEKK